MSKRFIVRSLFVATALAFVVGILPAPLVLAYEDEDAASTTSSSEDKTSEEERSTTLKSGVEARDENRGNRLSTTKLRLCQARKTSIGAIMKRGTVRGDNQLKLFNAIFQRVQTFYAKQGNVLAHYDELVSAVTAAQSKATTDITVLKGMSGTFDCNSEDPKGDAAAFKTATKLVAEDLRAYRSALKDLISGVKSVQPKAQRAEGGQQ